MQYVFQLLFMSVIIGVLVSWIISIHAALKLHESAKVGKANQENCGEYYLEGESARALIYDTYNKNIESLQENTLTYMLVLVIMLVGIMAVIFGILSYKNKSKWLILGTTFLIYIGIFIFSVISRSGLNDKISFMIGTSLEEKNLIGSQVGYLVGITLFIALSFAVYKYNIQEESSVIKSDHFKYILGCMVILSIFIPVMTSDIFKLKKNIDDYYTFNVVGEDVNSLNKKIQNEYETNSLLQNHLRINIQRLNDTDELPVIDEEYKKELYKYVMHGMNMAEIRNIVIPEALFNKINSKYLRGENIVVLKTDLLGYYNGGALNETLKRYFKDNNNKYIDGLTDATLTTLLNTHVRNNDTYKINNNIPSDIRNKMQALRQNTQMEDTVAAYYSKIGAITIALFILGFYIIFHRIYDESDMFRQSVALIMMILMIFVGFLGWFFKELWL